MSPLSSSAAVISSHGLAWAVVVLLAGAHYLGVKHWPLGQHGIKLLWHIFLSLGEAASPPWRG